jgi:O-antigen ligase
MHQYAIVFAIEAALLVAVLILREPKLLIPAVIIGLPFEYLQTQTLDTLGEGGVGGAVRTLLNPGKLAMLATICVGVVRARHNPRALFPDSSILLPIAGLLALVALGVFWSDSLVPPNAVAIMPMYVAFVFIAPSFIEDRRDMERIVFAFLITAGELSLIAIAQRLFHVFNWREILIQSDAYSYRSNATFADPNNLARYLAISVALGIAMIFATGPRRLTVYIAGPAIALSALAIVATASRSGWVALVLVCFLVLMMAPIPRYTKLRVTVIAGTFMAIMIGLLLVQGGTSAARVRSLASGVSAIGQREFLIRAGWEMWKDSPFIGVGSGNYQNSLIISYLWAVPAWARVSLSHTSIISILAELGILGVAMFAFVSIRVAISLVRAYFATSVPQNRLMIGWCAAALSGILFQSQSEGRLLDEPYLWLVLAIFVALETGRAFTARTVPEARATTIAEPAPARGTSAGRPERLPPRRAPVLGMKSEPEGLPD